jgi:4-amino-4-deoxy-L-arabinose transferase-like glycosyltransferase
MDPAFRCPVAPRTAGASRVTLYDSGGYKGLPAPERKETGLATDQITAPPEETFADAVLGKGFFSHPVFRRFQALAPEWQVALIVTGLAAVLFIPYLGAVGLWDCWEPHYGEVAREMIQRNDYVIPWWESAWFFSKPPLTMWMTALGMQIVGTNRAVGPVALYTEWGMRLPIALYSIFSLALFSFALTRTVGKRVGLAFGVILSTMPLYFLLSRQAVTDLPVVGSIMCALACAIVGQFDEKTAHRSAWWYGFYVFCGLGVLAKEVMGIAFPAATIALWLAICVMPWSVDNVLAHLRWLYSPQERAKVGSGEVPMPFLWGQFFKMRLGTGILVWAATCLPWYAILWRTTGVDDENERFWFRVVFHDNFNRIAEGVHTTTPGGTFIYFIEQAGFAIFPWVALIPLVFWLAGRLRLRGGGTREQIGRLAIIWSALSFFIVAGSATKFHHYVFPVLPGLAVLLALAVDALWSEGIAEHAASLVLGGVLFVLVGKDLSENPKNFTDLFVYNYERPYPHFLDNRTVRLFGAHTLGLGDLLAATLLVLGVYFLVDTFGRKGASLWARGGGLVFALGGGALLLASANPGKVAPALALGIALVVGAGFIAYEAFKRAALDLRLGIFFIAGVVALVGIVLLVSGATAKAGDDGMARALADPVTVITGMGYVFGLTAALGFFALIMRWRTMLFGIFLALAVGFSGWFQWSHWVELSHHWTQRDLFWRYYRMRETPDEPIVAFLMNWRGETFYSRNTVRQFRDARANERMHAYADQPGHKWALVEHNRLGILQSAVGTNHRVNVIDQDLNNKFVLVKID